MNTNVKVEGKDEIAYIPCDENDERCVGGFTSNDGQSLCLVREITLHTPAPSEDVDSFVKNVAWESWKQVYIENIHTGWEIGDDDPTSKGHNWDWIYDGEFTKWWNKQGMELLKSSNSITLDSVSAIFAHTAASKATVSGKEWFVWMKAEEIDLDGMGDKWWRDSITKEPITAGVAYWHFKEGKFNRIEVLSLSPATVSNGDAASQSYPRWVKASEDNPTEGWYNAKYNGSPCVLDVNNGHFILTFPNGKIETFVKVNLLEYIEETPSSIQKKEERMFSLSEVNKILDDFNFSIVPIRKDYFKQQFGINLEK